VVLGKLTSPQPRRNNKLLGRLEIQKIIGVSFKSVEKLECKACLAAWQSKLCAPVIQLLLQMKHTQIIEYKKEPFTL
jgi:hypothetical protein